MYFPVENRYLEQDTEILASSYSKSRPIVISFIFYYIHFNAAKSLHMYQSVFAT